ncbi:hypothetical protein BDR26DRAFT_282514 [Obelidium mucronatum]|nr:hypothetical protein BDR26DRAFT_282514 [Obelidium mucronatum]
MVHPGRRDIRFLVGRVLARILWDTYFAAGQFDGVDFDIEGLVGSAGTGSDLAAIIHYFRQQGGQDFIISVAPYSGFQGMQDAQDVVRDGIARAASSISYLNVQTYDVYYNGIEDNGLLAENYNWYTNQYGIPVNVGINVCVHQAKATLYDMQWFTRLLNVPPAGLFLWTTDCASRNLWNGVVGLRSKDFADWVHGSFPY